MFYQVDYEAGVANCLYILLNPVGHGIPEYEEGDKFIEQESISEGGSTMIVWSRLLFDELDKTARQAILKSLY